MITQKVLKTLEYDKILGRLAQHCGCCISRELALELRPKTELDDVNADLTLTSEAESYFLRTGYTPVDDFPDMRSALKRMNAVLFLNCEELLNIGKCLKAIRVAREQLVPHLPLHLAGRAEDAVAPHEAAQQVQDAAEDDLQAQVPNAAGVDGARGQPVRHFPHELRDEQLDVVHRDQRNNAEYEIDANDPCAAGLPCFWF